jgi:hypothetical protein
VDQPARKPISWVTSKGFSPPTLLCHALALFVVDNLNIHYSESLVRCVAAESGLVEIELGEKGKHGILKNRQSRATFLSDAEHRIVFHYTPKHSLWLNQRSRSG